MSDDFVILIVKLMNISNFSEILEIQIFKMILHFRISMLI